MTTLRPSLPLPTIASSDALSSPQKSLLELVLILLVFSDCVVVPGTVVGARPGRLVPMGVSLTEPEVTRMSEVPSRLPVR